MLSAKLLFEGVKCDRCGYVGWADEMRQVTTEPFTFSSGYECKDKSECFDMLQVIDEFTDNE